eukprot:1664523-Prymnesium_polylepis.1
MRRARRSRACSRPSCTARRRARRAGTRRACNAAARRYRRDSPCRAAAQGPSCRWSSPRAHRRHRSAGAAPDRPPGSSFPEAASRARLRG